MSIETINIDLFYWINSAAKKYPFLDYIAIFCSHNLITIFVLLIIILSFFKDKKYRVQFFKTLIIVAISLLVTQIIHSLYYHPRPFVLGLGHKLVAHGSSSSIPSQHTLTIATIAFSYLFAKFWKIGLLGLGISLMVAWSRIYVGVHFPLDILASFSISLILTPSVYFLMEKLIMMRKNNFMRKRERGNAWALDDLP